MVADHAAMAAVLRDRPEGFRRTKRLRDVGAEMGLAGGVFGAEGEAWKRQRRMVMAGFDPRHLRAYFPSLVKVSHRLEGRWRQAAAKQATDRPAGRPDALHRRCDLRPRLRRRREHARVRRRHHPAPPRQDLPGDVPPYVLAAAAASLVEDGGRPPARAQRRRGQPGDRRLHRGGAGPPRRRARAAGGAAQPARSDAGRRRRRRFRHHRHRGLGQRDDDAAGRRGHDGQHAGLGDLAAAHAPGLPRARPRRGRRARPATRANGRRSASPRSTTSRPAPTRRCA